MLNRCVILTQFVHFARKHTIQADSKCSQSTATFHYEGAPLPCVETASHKKGLWWCWSWGRRWRFNKCVHFLMDPIKFISFTELDINTNCWEWKGAERRIWLFAPLQQEQLIWAAEQHSGTWAQTLKIFHSKGSRSSSLGLGTQKHSTETWRCCIMEGTISPEWIISVYTCDVTTDLGPIIHYFSFSTVSCRELRLEFNRSEFGFPEIQRKWGKKINCSNTQSFGVCVKFLLYA